MIVFTDYPMPFLRAEQKDGMLEILQFLPKSQDWICLFRALCDYREWRLKEQLENYQQYTVDSVHTCVAQSNTPVSVRLFL